MILPVLVLVLYLGPYAYQLGSQCLCAYEHARTHAHVHALGFCAWVLAWSAVPVFAVEGPAPERFHVGCALRISDKFSCGGYRVQRQGSSLSRAISPGRLSGDEGEGEVEVEAAKLA
eukprot:1783590-Rhodomonas_salina.2